jgi:hypothetical protein
MIAGIPIVTAIMARVDILATGRCAGIGVGLLRIAADWELVTIPKVVSQVWCPRSKVDSALTKHQATYPRRDDDSDAIRDAAILAGT